MHFFVLQVYNSNDYNMNWLYYNCLKMALKQERVHFVFRPKQSMYFRIFFLYRVRVSNPQRLTYTQILVEYCIIIRISTQSQIRAHPKGRNS